MESNLVFSISLRNIRSTFIIKLVELTLAFSNQYHVHILNTLENIVYIAR